MTFHARPLRTLGYAILLLGLSAVFSLVAWLQAQAALLSGVLGAAALGLGILGLILVVRAIRRPVMVRIDESGVFMRRLDADFPWSVIEAIEIVDIRGEHLVALVPAEPSHSVWAQRGVQMGRALSAKAGLPELVVDFSGLEPGREAFLAEATRLGRVPVRRVA
ncbi:MAG: hypothetical protein AAFY43_04525 [Pseudomonadota bacterium]